MEDSEYTEKESEEEIEVSEVEDESDDEEENNLKMQWSMVFYTDDLNTVTINFRPQVPRKRR